MKKLGMTLVEVLITLAIVAALSLGIALFFFQTSVFQDQISSMSGSSRTVQRIMETLNNSIEESETIDVPNSTTLQVQIGDICEVYSLQNQIIYRDIGASGSPCPSPSTSNPLHDETTRITNASSPSVETFTGIPTGTDSQAVKLRIRARDVRNLADDELYTEQTITKRL